MTNQFKLIELKYEQINIQLYCFGQGKQSLLMFNLQKVKELEIKSHNRGALSKEFYQNQQEELEKKRREMKMMLDQQIEEKRRKKEKERYEEDRKYKKEEQDIKMYYQNLDQREGKKIDQMAGGQSGIRMMHPSYQTFPNPGQPIDSRVLKNNKNYEDSKKRTNSKATILISSSEAEIPLMPVMPISDFNSMSMNAGHYNSYSNQNQQSILSNSKFNSNLVNAGNIPLLDLSDEPSTFNLKSKKGKKKEKEKNQPSHGQLHQNSRQNAVLQKIEQRSRRNTVQDQDSVVMNQQSNNSVNHYSNQRRNTQIQEEIIEFQQENKSLKQELKKNQEALSLLIGAVRSNAKLDKYRVQAEKILYGQGNQNQQNYKNHQNYQNQELEQSRAQKKSNRHNEGQKTEQILLPKLHLKHQSIMHDYLLNAALRNVKNKYVQK